MEETELVNIRHLSRKDISGETKRGEEEGGGGLVTIGYCLTMKKILVQFECQPYGDDTVSSRKSTRFDHCSVMTAIGF